LTKSVVNDVDKGEDSAGSLPEGSNKNSWNHISGNKYKEEDFGSLFDDSNVASSCDKVRLTTATRSRKNDAVGLSFIFHLAPGGEKGMNKYAQRKGLYFDLMILIKMMNHQRVLPLRVSHIVTRKCRKPKQESWTTKITTGKLNNSS